MQRNVVIDVTPETPRFGTELRRRRIEAGHSLADLSRLVHYSRSHLSKVETGSKAPSTDLARRCDAVLRCEGVLAELGERQAAAGAAREGEQPEGEVWVLELGAQGERRLLLATRRDLLAAGVLGGIGGPAGDAQPPGVRASGVEFPRALTTGKVAADGSESTVEVFRGWFRQLRSLGQGMRPDLLLPILTAHTQGLVTLARSASGPDRGQALLLAARYAEYAGWMAQEAGSDADAAWWTDRAVAYAEAAGDRGMSAYALVRRALIAMYQRDSARTVALAQAAQRADCRPRIRGLAAQREAQGHALAGSRSACLAALDRAGELLATDPVNHAELVIGSCHVPDLVMAASGWSLVELGRPKEAAPVLREVLGSIPRAAMRARGRYGARLALALATCRELDEACAVTDEVLDAFPRLQSATIAADLRTLTRTMRRWHTHPGARRVGLRLATVLQSAPARADYLAAAAPAQ